MAGIEAVFRRFWVLLGAAGFIVGVMTAGAVAADESGEAEPERRPEFVYQSLAEPEAVVEAALSRASDNGKLALLVFGAEWCHDSRALGANFSKPALYAELTPRYEIVFIDLGFYDRATELFSSFGMPTYFGTPTVLVVDPETRTVLNEDSLSIWQSAATASMDTYQDYFAQDFMTDRGHSPETVASLRVIRQWEAVQAKRLRAGYDAVGPLLSRDVAGESTEGLNQLWREVRDFRIALQRDLVALRERAYAGESFNSETEWPVYQPHSWELPIEG